MNFHYNSKNKNRKIDFSFDSAHCASFMNVGSKLKEGGENGEVCISLVRKKQETGPVMHFMALASYPNKPSKLFFSKSQK